MQTRKQDLPGRNTALFILTTLIVFGPFPVQSDELTATSIAIAGEGTVYVAGEYYSDEPDDAGYWVARIDGAGETLWLKRFSEPDGTERTNVIALDNGRCLIVSNRYIMNEGNQPFLQELGADGTAGAPVNVISTATNVNAAMQLANGHVLLAGSVLKDERGEGEQYGYDAWAGEAAMDGTLVWQEPYDHGKDEDFYGLASAPDGGFYAIGNSGTLDKFGSGQSEVWLLHCDASGKLVKDAVFPDGRFAVESSCDLVSMPDGSLAMAYSLPQSAIPSDVKRHPMSFPACVRVVDDTFATVNKLDFVENRAVSTPFIALSAEGELLLAYAGAKTPMLTVVTFEGKASKPVQGEKWPFRPFLDLSDTLVQGDKAYVLGGVADFMSDEDDDNHVFLACFDVKQKKVLWQKEIK